MELAFNWKKQAPPSLPEKHPGKIGDIPRNLNYVFVKGRPLRVQVQPCARRSATLRSAKCNLALGEVQPCARRSAALRSAKCSLALGEVQPCTRRSATLHSRQPMEGFSAADGAGKKVQKILNNSMKSMRTRVPHYMLSLGKTRPQPLSQAPPEKLGIFHRTSRLVFFPGV